MPRGYHKQWNTHIDSGVVRHNYRFVNPMPTGALPDTSQQHRGRELEATEQDSRGGYQKKEERSIADFWAVKGAPLNEKGSKAIKRSGKGGGTY